MEWLTFRESAQWSIRDLKDAKSPTSSNQMAALVAYYLSGVPPPDERRDAINSGDLQKYFKQAGFKLDCQIQLLKRFLMQRLRGISIRSVTVSID